MNLEIREFAWDYRENGNVAHIRSHGVSPSDFLEVYGVAPRFFLNRRDNSTHIMIGANRQGRYLAAALMETFDEGTWIVVTAYWLDTARGERLYNR